MHIRNTSENSESSKVLTILIAAIIVFRFLYPPFSILTWDVFGYYLYLPATFIHGDPALRDPAWLQQVFEQYQPSSTLYQIYPLHEGGNVIKYSSGMALLNLPAFLIAHAICLFTGINADGFTTPYQFAWTISGLLYTAAGLWIMRKVLLKFFNDRITSLLLILLVLGTNYFQLTAFDGYITHNYLFTLFAFILWFTIKWHEKPAMSTAIALGISIGLAVLTRPNEMVIMLIPLLWNVFNRISLQEKFRLISKNYLQISATGAVIVIIGSVQLIYWKYTTGNWIFYSYNNAGEGFDFSHPYLLQVLFSFRKGWFVYTPLMLFTVAGFYFLWKSKREVFWPSFLYFIINLYIVSSWTCWWYAGGSYSQRALLSSYAVLLLPLGYLIDFVNSKSKTIRYSFAVVLGLLVLLNLFQTWQWVHGIIDRTRMSRNYYFAVFAKTSVSEDDRKLLLVERSTEQFQELKNEPDYNKRTLAKFDFEGENYKARPLSKDTVHSGNAALRMDKDHQYSPGFETTFLKLTTHDHAWLRAGVWVYPLHDVEPRMASIVITAEHNGEAYAYNAIGIDNEKYHIKKNQWNYISLDYLTPEVRSGDDKIKAYFWLQGDKPLLIDDMVIEVFEPKE